MRTLPFSRPRRRNGIDLAKISAPQLFKIILDLAQVEDPELYPWMRENRAALLIMIEETLRGRRPSPSDQASAIQYVIQASDYLASLPPPAPEKKDLMGLSGSSNNPIRNYLMLIRMGEDVPIEAHLGAAEYLRQHARTQLDPEQWLQAHEVLSQASSLSAADAAQFLRATTEANASLAHFKDVKGNQFDVQDDRIVLRLKGRVKGERLRDAGIPAESLKWDREAVAWSISAADLDDLIKALTSLGKGDLARALAASKAAKAAEKKAAEKKAAALAELAKAEEAAARRAEEAAKLPAEDLTEWTTGANGKTVWRWDPKNPGDIVQVRNMQSVSGRWFSKGWVQNVRGLSRNDYINRQDRSGTWTASATPRAVEAFTRDPGIAKNFPTWQEVREWVEATQDTARGLEADTADTSCGPLVNAWKATSLADLPKDVADEMKKALSSISWPRGIKPYPYQEVGIGLGLLRGGSVYIADGMGLGKTLQAIGLLKSSSKMTPALVVSPSSVVYNWQDEIRKFAPSLDPQPVVDSKAKLPPKRANTVLLMSWDMARRRVRDILAWGPKTLVLDEAHYAKNQKAKRTKAVLAISKKADHRILLSGTPFPNRPIELYAQLEILDPYFDAPIWAHLDAIYPRGSNYTKFARQYADGHRTRFGFDVSGSSNLGELQEQLACLGVARDKDQPAISSQLPPKIRKRVWIPKTGQVAQAYSRAIDSFLGRACDSAKKKVAAKFKDQWPRIRLRVEDPEEAVARLTVWANSQLPDLNASQELLKIGALLRDVGKLKIPTAVKWIEGFLQAHRDRQLVVFVKHKAVLKGIGKALEKLGISWTYVDGAVGQEERNQRTRDFREGKYRVLVASQALREGANLQSASDMLFVERWWVPGWEVQAEDRIHRQGSTHGRDVEINYLMLEDSVDTRINEVVEAKRKVFKAVFGGDSSVDEKQAKKQAAAIQKEVLDSLLASTDMRSGCSFTLTEVALLVDALA